MASVYFSLAILGLLLTGVISLLLGSWATMAFAPLAASGLVFSFATFVLIHRTRREAGPTRSVTCRAGI